MVFNLYFTNTNDSWLLLGSNMTTSQIKIMWRSKSTLLLTQAAGACGCVRDGSQGCCRWRKGSCQVLRQRQLAVHFVNILGNVCWDIVIFPWNMFIMEFIRSSCFLDAGSIPKNPKQPMLQLGLPSWLLRTQNFLWSWIQSTFWRWHTG